MYELINLDKIKSDVGNAAISKEQITFEGLYNEILLWKEIVDCNIQNTRVIDTDPWKQEVLEHTLKTIINLNIMKGLVDPNEKTIELKDVGIKEERFDEEINLSRQEKGRKFLSNNNNLGVISFWNKMFPRSLCKHLNLEYTGVTLCHNNQIPRLNYLIVGVFCVTSRIQLQAEQNEVLCAFITKTHKDPFLQYLYK